MPAAAEKQVVGIPTTTSSSSTATATAVIDDPQFLEEYEIDSTCSTPYVSAPSSPGRGGQGAPVSGFYYSAPASPVHFVLSTSTLMNINNANSIPSQPEPSPTSSTCSFEFDFSASKFSGNGASSGGSMSSADELFLNGQIRPMKLSTHLQRPQVLAPLLDLDEADEDVDEVIPRGRDAAKIRDRSLRRRARSMSPLRTNTPFGWNEDFGVEISDGGGGGGMDENKKQEGEEDEQAVSGETTPCESGGSSRSSSVGRSSSRWVFLKEFLYRSKSEGRNNGHKFWRGSLSFSPVKDKIKMDKFIPTKIPPNICKEKPELSSSSESAANGSEAKKGKQNMQKDGKKKIVNGVGVGKRRVPPSPHELHYTANRAQAEEMRKKTFLPYRQGLLGCLGFSSKSYGAMNGFARALNPVYSR